MENKELYKRALDTWGEGSQVMMLVEECGELLNAITKYYRKRVEIPDVITELADVSIMVEQMAVNFGYADFLKEKQRKLDRLQNRLDQYQNTHTHDNSRTTEKY